jgi:hypothetical protein
MTLYKSKYPELSFYVGNERKKFNHGKYRTDNKKDIEVLDGLMDAVKVEKSKTDEPKSEEKPKSNASSKSKRK